MSGAYQRAHVDEIPAAAPRVPGGFEWRPVRHHFDVRAFGVNAFVAPDVGDWVIEEHTEAAGGAERHEELYFVARGRARFEVEGEAFEASAGTLVFVRDPEARRGARALEPGTTVLAVGARPGTAYSVSAWERRHFGE